jgi:hypothetical protein
MSWINSVARGRLAVIKHMFDNVKQSATTQTIRAFPSLLERLRRSIPRTFPSISA